MAYGPTKKLSPPTSTAMRSVPLIPIHSAAVMPLLGCAMALKQISFHKVSALAAWGRAIPNRFDVAEAHIDDQCFLGVHIEFPVLSGECLRQIELNGVGLPGRTASVAYRGMVFQVSGRHRGI